MPQLKEADSYILDTYRSGEGTYHPGAILFSGRRRMETVRWKEHVFQTQQEADEYARDEISRTRHLMEKSNEGELRSRE